MNMVFLYPSFLFALFALAVPIVIHYFNFRRYKRISFSNVALLEELSQQSRSRNKLREWLVLACRILALLFLVFAFSQPLIPPAHQSAQSSTERLVSIYVDNSNSMSNRNKAGSLLEEAKSQAREIAETYGPNTRFQLLTNDFEGRLQRFLYRNEFLSLLAGVSISSYSRTLKDIFARQNDLFAEYRGAQKEVFLISDFQSNMLPGPMSLKDSTGSIHLIPLKAIADNVYIDSVWNANPVQRPGEREQVIVRIRRSTNSNSYEDLDIPVKVYLNGSLKSVSTLHMGNKREVRDTVAYVIQEAGAQNLELRIEDASIFFDDHFYASWKVDSSAIVLHIQGEGRNPFIRALYSGDPYFKLEENEEGHIDYASFNACKLIILDQLKKLPSGLALELKKFMAKGGNVLFLPRIENDLTVQKEFLGAFQLDLPVGLIHQQKVVRGIDLHLDLFKGVFSTFPRHPNLPYIKDFYRYSQRKALNSEVLLGADEDDFLLKRYAVGAGNWYQSSVPLSDSNGNFQRHALFVPVMYKLALLSGVQYPLFYTVGKDQILSAPPLRDAERAGLKLLGNHTELIPELRQAGDKSNLYISSSLSKDGFYRLENGGKQIGAYAFNFDRSESDMHFFDSAHLESLTGIKSAQILNSGNQSVRELIKNKRLGTPLWKVCLILSLAFLGIESLVLRFRRPRKAVITT